MNTPSTSNDRGQGDRGSEVASEDPDGADNRRARGQEGGGQGQGGRQGQKKNRGQGRKRQGQDRGKGQGGGRGKGQGTGHGGAQAKGQAKGGRKNQGQGQGQGRSGRGKGQAGRTGRHGRVEADDPAAQLKRPLERVLSRLPETQRKVLELRMGLTDGHPHDLSDTAQALGLSMGEAREIERRAFEHIREVVPLQQLQRFLDR